MLIISPFFMVKSIFFNIFLFSSYENEIFSNFNNVSLDSAFFGEELYFIQFKIFSFAVEKSILSKIEILSHLSRLSLLYLSKEIYKGSLIFILLNKFPFKILSGVSSAIILPLSTTIILSISLCSTSSSLCSIIIVVSFLSL